MRAVFLRDGESHVATELARGPWDPGQAHGGAPAALIAGALDAVPGPDGLITARVTFELLRPVPLGRLVVRAAAARTGRRAQLLEATLLGPGEVELVRARAIRVMRTAADVDAPGAVSPAPPPAGPATVRDLRVRPPAADDETLFGPDAIELRFVRGSFGEPGPATAWFRLRVPVVSGEAVTPLQRVCAAADFGNGISAVLDWSRHVFINPDLTVYLEREPVGEWIGLESETRIELGGVGFAESVLWDERGRFGRSVQALLVARR